MKRYVVGFTSKGTYVCEEKPDGGWMSADEVLPRIAELEGIADARMERINELEAMMRGQTFVTDMETKGEQG